MTDYRHHIFDTALGPCGVLWSAKGIRRAQLPEKTAEAAERRLTRGLESEAAEPDGVAAQAIAGIRALMEGEPETLDDLPLDEADLGEFDRTVYAACRATPRGETTTYGALALRLGSPGRSRAVGQSLGRNPFAPIVPCHRVLASGGGLGGFSAVGGLTLKTHLLRIEGAKAVPGPNLFEHFGVEPPQD